MTGWHTIVGLNGKAHYLVEGVASCTLSPSGRHYFGKFTRPWRELAQGDHVCGNCKRAALLERKAGAT